MKPERKPFHEVDYREEEGTLCPILEIIIGKNKKPISAYADTGCSTGIFVFQEQIKGIDLGTKINDEPSRCIVADGHVIGGDEYKTTAYIDGEKREIVITVVDPTKEFIHVFWLKGFRQVLHRQHDEHDYCYGYG